MNKFGQKGHLTIVALAFRYQKTLTQTHFTLNLKVYYFTFWLWDQFLDQIVQNLVPQWAIFN